jgi:hypothetical protein
MPEEEVCLNGEFRKLDSGDMSRISAQPPADLLLTDKRSFISHAALSVITFTLCRKFDRTRHLPKCIKDRIPLERHANHIESPQLSNKIINHLSQYVQASSFVHRWYAQRT